MGTRGPAPKGHASRERDQRRRNDDQATEIVPDGLVHGPELPAVTWHAATVAWWRHWRESPVSQLWDAIDWDFALATATVHTNFYLRPSALLAAELRQRESKMGQTFEDRQRLRIRIVSESTKADEVTPAGVAAISDYRRTIAG